MAHKRLQRLWVPGPLPGLNDIIADNKIARSARRKNGEKAIITKYDEVKKRWNEYIMVQSKAQKFEPITEPSHFIFLCYEKHRLRDPDNIECGAKKIILDALVKAKLLPNDGQKNVLGLPAYWAVRETQPGVVLYVAPGWLAKEQAFLLEEHHERRDQETGRTDNHALGQNPAGEA